MSRILSLRRPDCYWWLAVALTYVAVYGSMLVSADGAPYVMDNNESFSSLLHALNLYEHGVAKSYGLADEALGPPAAHPYVHTHQGNFPRLFAFLIYVLGARTVEAQIAVTTFTVGAGAIALLYWFFARIATAGFAALVCTIFMTDYVLFAQWHVVTYRVWHSFLLFLGLYSIQRISEGGPKRWLFTCGFAYACLFYFELVFAAFAGLFGALYAAVTMRSQTGRLMRAFGAMCIGGLAALAAVAMQAAGYLGWEDFYRDIYLTFVARNDFSASNELLAEAAAFYETRNIVFWHNIQERAPFMSILAFVRSFTAFDWRVHTPILSMVAWTLTIGWMGGLLTDIRAPKASRPLGLLDYLVVFLGVAAFAHASGSFSEIGSAGRSSIVRFSGNLALSLFACIVLWFLCVSLRANNASAQALRRLVRIASGFLLVAGLLLPVHRELFFKEYQLVWEELLVRFAPGAWASIVLAGAIIVAAIMVTRGAQRAFGEMGKASLQNVLRYIAAGSVAYIVVYLLSPGYIFTGYLGRHAPFTVFLTDVVLAAAVYACIRTSIHLFRVASGGYDNALAPESGTYLARASIAPYVLASLAAISCLVLMVLSAYWAHIQVQYVRWLPPDHYAFLKLLRQTPFKGRSYVVNTYAAPIGVTAGYWAYFDPEIERAITRRTEQHLYLVGHAEYLWFADRRSNDSYRKPDFFVCVVPQNLWTVLSGILRERGYNVGNPGCLSRPLVRMAAEDQPYIPGLVLAAYDQSALAGNGFDRWAIVSLPWDDRPGGLALDWSSQPRTFGPDN